MNYLCNRGKLVSKILYWSNSTKYVNALPSQDTVVRAVITVHTPASQYICRQPRSTLARCTSRGPVLLTDLGPRGVPVGPLLPRRHDVVLQLLRAEDHPPVDGRHLERQRLFANEGDVELDACLIPTVSALLGKSARTNSESLYRHRHARELQPVRTQAIAFHELAQLGKQCKWLAIYL